MYSDIFASLMQYNNAFYSVVYESIDFEQKNAEMYNFNENSNNSFVTTFAILLNLFIQELEICLKKLKIVYIICIIAIFAIFIGIFILLYFSFLSANKRRLNYMEIFYGINDNILKSTIINCHNFIHKLEKYESYKPDEEDDDLTFDLSIEHIKIKKNDKNENNESINNNNKKSNYFAENNIYIIILGLFLLIIYAFFILNYIYIFKLSDEVQLMHKFMCILNNYHLKLINIFNGYKIYLFDEKSVGIDNRIILDLLEEYINDSYDSISTDVDYIQEYINSHITMNEELKKVMNKGLCSYYITDYFNSEEDCIEKYKNIINHDFIIFASYFIQEIRIRKNLVTYILSTGIFRGKLNEFRVDLWMADDTIPKIYSPKNITYRFRLDLFNNETMHNYLNNIYINIIIPYVDTNRKALLKSLKLKVKNVYFIVFSCISLFISVFIFYIFWIPIVFFFNDIIYKTKNMLSIIPTNILIYKSNIEILKDLFKN